MTHNTTTRYINHYITEEVEHFSYQSSLSSKIDDERLILELDGEQHKLWTCLPFSPRDDGDYDPLEGVDGVEMKTVYSSGRAGQGETRYKHRYKFTRELVEEHDDVVLIKRHRKSGGNVDGVDYDKDQVVDRWRLVADN